MSVVSFRRKSPPVGNGRLPAPFQNWRFFEVYDARFDLQGGEPDRRLAAPQ